MVRRRRQSRLGDGLPDSPVRLRGEVRGPRLDDKTGTGGHDLPDESVELDAVELRGGDVVGIGQVGDDGVIGRVLGFPQPRERIGGDRRHPRIVERVLIRGREVGRGAGEVDDAGIEVDEGDGFDVGVLEDLPHGEPVAAAEDEDIAAGPVHQRMDEGLVVPVLVDRGELQVPVEIEAGVTGAQGLGDDDLLVVGALGDDDGVAVEALPRRHLDVVGEDPHDGEAADDEDEEAGEQDPGAAGHLGAEEPEDDEDADDGVGDADRERPLRQPEEGEEDEREGESADEAPDVVGGEEIGDGARGPLRPDALDELHEQGDLRADERSDEEREPDHRHRVDVGEGEREVEEDDGEAADDAERGFDEGERDGGEAGEALRRERPDAHREDHDGEHDRGLDDRVAKQVGPKRDERELVDHPAARADEDGEEDEEAGRPRLQRECQRCRRGRAQCGRILRAAPEPGRAAGGAGVTGVRRP